MNLSDEAVEAVLKVLSEHVDASECCVRAALEAAATHLMAQAWEDGYDARTGDAYEWQTPNPYRSAGDGDVEEHVRGEAPKELF